MDFAALKKVDKCVGIKKLITLTLNKKYIIHEVSVTNTSIGRSIILDLGVFRYWLPKRYNNFFNDEVVKDFNDNYKYKSFIIVKEIRKYRRHDYPIIEINLLKENEEKTK